MTFGIFAQHMFNTTTHSGKFRSCANEIRVPIWSIGKVIGRVRSQWLVFELHNLSSIAFSLACRPHCATVALWFRDNNSIVSAKSLRPDAIYNKWTTTQVYRRCNRPHSVCSDPPPPTLGRRRLAPRWPSYRSSNRLAVTKISDTNRRSSRASPSCSSSCWSQWCSAFGWTGRREFPSSLLFVCLCVSVI